MRKLTWRVMVENPSLKAYEAPCPKTGRTYRIIGTSEGPKGGPFRHWDWQRVYYEGEVSRKNRHDIRGPEKGRGFKGSTEIVHAFRQGDPGYYSEEAE